jgi:hypothetical protein
MLAGYPLDHESQPGQVLDRLLRQQGLLRYGLFFVTDEGEPALDGSGESSGMVIDQHGRTFFFVVDWSAGQRDGVLTEWEEVPPEPDWHRSAAYRRARLAAGLAEP